MALSTFVPVVAPGITPQVTTQARVRKAEFGDGYTKRSPDGLNAMRRSLELSWDTLTMGQKNNLEDFFVSQGGAKSFYYQPYGYPAPIKWTCEEWGWSGTAPFSFRAKLDESFTLES